LSSQEITNIVGVSTSQFATVNDWLVSLGGRSIQLCGNNDAVRVEMPLEIASSFILHNGELATHELVSEDVSDIVVFAFSTQLTHLLENDQNDGDSESDSLSHSRKRLSKHERWATYESYSSPNSQLADPNSQKNAIGMPIDLVANNSRNLQMVWGPGTYGYLESDLAAFYQQFNIPGKTSTTKVFGNTGSPGGDNFYEGTLDTQYIAGMGLGVRTLVANTNTSSSTEEGPGFSQALFDFTLELANMSDDTLPLVLSMSLGSLSWDSCNILCTKGAAASQGQFDYSDCLNYVQFHQRQVCMLPRKLQEQRISTEFMKLSARGMTLLGAAGDGGSHYSFEPFGASTIGSVLNTVSCELNFPTFVSASPYVLAVGGTQWSSDPSQPTHWPAGGAGFAWNYARPSYQDAVVTQYLSENQGSQNFPPPHTFNSTGRAYSDIATLASNVPIVANGRMFPAGGTSAAAPSAAGMISMINDHRLNNDLPSLGFLHPRLYTMATTRPGLFYDMTTGSSACTSAGTCCATGFPSAKGWDVNTGLGQLMWEPALHFLGRDSDMS
jgi:hypothetical protein